MMIALNHWLLDGAISASIVLCAGVLATLLFRNPARQQRLGELAIVGAMVTLLITALPGSHWIFLGWLPGPSVAHPFAGHPQLHIGLPGGNGRGYLSGRANIRQTSAAPISAITLARKCVRYWPQFLSVAYLLGVLFMAGRLALGWVLLKKAASRATSFSRGDLLSRPRETPAHWFCRHDTDIRISDNTLTPTAFGIFHPVILIPRRIADSDDATLRLALAHEEAHITRGDTILRIIIAVAGVLLFFHPLLWILRRRIRLNQEFLADQIAATASPSHGAYVNAMLEIARSVQSGNAGFLPAVTLIGRRSDFYLRMNRLMAGEDKTLPDCSLRWCICAAAAMAVIILPASMLTLGSPNPPHNANRPFRLNAQKMRSHAQNLIERGLAYLGRKQKPDGAWLGRYGPAVTALAVRGFIEAGLPESNRHIQRALRFIESSRHHDGGFYGNVEPAYNTAIVLRTLSMLPQRRYKRQARMGLAFLHGELQASTGWRGPTTRWYDQPSVYSGWAGTKRPFSVPGGLSASDQISAGLSMASNTLDPTERSADTVLTRYGEITYAQLKSMIYAGLGPHDPRVLRLSRWIASHYTLSCNPAENSPRGVYYYYVVFAQTLRAAGRRDVIDSAGVRHNWRQDLVEALARRSDSAGGWRNAASRSWLEGNPVMATTYAVLALDQVIR